MSDPLKDAAWSDRPIAAYLLGVAAICACVAAYYPGLQGPFLFDDFGSLAELGDLGGVRDWATFRTFVLGGDAGPTGRPLALLTFLIDGTSWPTDPWPFKRTNLIIHIIFAITAATLTFRLLLISGFNANRAKWLAIVSAAAWLLHPFLVSTTLYIVQRMAQLSGLFVLLGMLGYLLGRIGLQRNRALGHAIMTASVVLFTTLAALCKENGVLLPILILVMEFTLLSPNPRMKERPSLVWFMMFVGVPSAAVLAYLLSFAIGDAWLRQNPDRGVSVYERALTETRIIMDYLRHWFAPSLYTSGVFQDHHAPSRGLLQPVTTALALTAHIVIALLAATYRKRQPLVAFSILFFYAAHLLESTFVNLELYFEHRNYLPAAFLPLIVVLAIDRARSQRFAVVSSLAILIMLASFTRYSASIWSDYSGIVEAAARKAPESARAQQQYSQLLFNAGDLANAVTIADAAIAQQPDTESLRLYRVILGCRLSNDTKELFQELSRVAAQSRFDVRLFDYYESLTSLIVSGACASVSITDLRQLYSTMLTQTDNSNPRFVGFHQLAYLLGVTELQLGRVDAATQLFRRALASRPTVGRAMLMAATMASTGHYYGAKVFSDIAAAMQKDEQSTTLGASGVTVEDIQHFRENLNRARNQLASESP